MSSIPRVMLLIPHLGGGGAEQVTALLARGLSPEKYELHLGLVTQTEAGETGLPPWVKVHGLGARRVRSGAFALLRLIRTVRPDVILSNMAHLNFLVLLLRPLFPQDARVLVRQNGTLSAMLSAGGVPWYTRLLYKFLYRRADTVICQTHAMADDLAGEIGLARNMVAVLPNPIDFDRIVAAQSAPALWQGAGPHLLAIGRLAPEKGFDLLIEAFAALRKRFAAAELVIAGAGTERAVLAEQCRALGVERAVRFPGYLECPYAYYPGATLFVLSSRQEGMPNALLEAAAAGLPLVATPASGGIVELLQGRPGAWLAPEISAAALEQTLIAALSALRPGKRFCRQFPRWPEPHEMQNRPAGAIEAYEELIDTACAARQA